MVLKDFNCSIINSRLDWHLEDYIKFILQYLLSFIIHLSCLCCLKDEIYFLMFSFFDYLNLIQQHDFCLIELRFMHFVILMICNPIFYLDYFSFRLDFILNLKVVTLLAKNFVIIFAIFWISKSFCFVADFIIKIVHQLPKKTMRNFYDKNYYYSIAKMVPSTTILEFPNIISFHLPKI